MPLIEYKIDGEYDRVKVACDRLRAFESIALQYSDKGYYVADSGGKDSQVIKKIAELSDVKFEITHNHTTADHPETVRFVRQEQQRYRAMGIDYTINYPKTSMWALIAKYGYPPLRTNRYCCAELKEGGGKDRVVVTGVRRSESVNRKKRGIAELQNKNVDRRLTLMNDNEESRKEFETCLRKGKRIVNPIIDWEDSDVWEFIRLYDLPYNPLYDKGYKRVGCVGCPMSDNYKELESNPAYKKMYMRAFDRMLKVKAEKGRDHRYNWKTAEDVYLWWTEQVKYCTDENKITIGELEEWENE